MGLVHKVSGSCATKGYSRLKPPYQEENICKVVDVNKSLIRVNVMENFKKCDDVIKNPESLQELRHC